MDSPPAVRVAQAAAPALSLDGLCKAFGQKVAVNALSLDVPTGSIYGMVGPNGAGKTTTLSMATGQLGVLPDGLRTFDRLTGMELITYAGLLRGLGRDVVIPRATQLLDVLDLDGAGRTLVADYSAGMRKKINLACALIHSPGVLVLDEPFEGVDPVSARTIQAILADFAADGGTVIISSHVMATVQRFCTHVAIVVAGQVAAAGTTAQVAAGMDLEDRFTQLVGARETRGDLSWLRPSSD